MNVKHAKAPEEKEEMPDNELAPEFRVVIVDGKRRGIRLEKLYWRLLEEIAVRRGEKRSRMIASIIENSSGAEDNVSSVLRAFVVNSLKDGQESEAISGAQKDLIRLMQQAPIPAFAINADKKLYQVNQEFVQLLRLLGGDMGGRVTPDVVQLTLGTPTEELFEQLERATSVHCSYVLQLDTKRRRGRVKVVTVPPSPGTMLIGYIIS